MRIVTRMAIVCFALWVLSGSGSAEERILIVGDSWAASIATVQHDGAGFGSFDAVLAANGRGRYTTRGDATAWGGRTSAFWDKTENRAILVSELTNHPTIDIVHLIIGGNDFLTDAKDHDLSNDSVRQSHFLTNAGHIQNIVNVCLAVRPNIRVVLADYDYLDITRAGLILGTNFNGATQRQFNDWLVELGQYKRVIAQTIDRCEYVQNWGTLQYWYNDPAGFSLPGGPPDYTPYPGGDLNSEMPLEAHVGDGIHPNDQAHRYMLQNAMNSFYLDWLAPDPEGEAEGQTEGVAEGEGEGVIEGEGGQVEGEGIEEGTGEGDIEGVVEGEGGEGEGEEGEGNVEGEGETEGGMEGEGETEGVLPEGSPEEGEEPIPAVALQIEDVEITGLGAPVPVPVRLIPGGAPMAALILDVVYDNACLSFLDASPEPALAAAGKKLGYLVISGNRVRLVISEDLKTVQPVEAGTLLTITFGLSMSASCWETCGANFHAVGSDYAVAQGPASEYVESHILPGGIGFLNACEGAAEGEGEGEGQCADPPVEIYSVLGANLSGNQVFPGTSSTATGTAFLEHGFAYPCVPFGVCGGGEFYDLFVTHTVANPTGAKLCYGTTGTTPENCIDLGAPASPISACLDAWPEEDWNGYVVISSAAYPNGEIAGQLCQYTVVSGASHWGAYDYICDNCCPYTNEGEGNSEGAIEGEGAEEGEGEGETILYATADQNKDGIISLSELLRVIQFFNSDGFHCDAGTEDGYAPGTGDAGCTPHSSDYSPQDWHIGLSELLRLIQFYNSGGYHYCTGSEDNFCPGP